MKFDGAQIKRSVLRTLFCILVAFLISKNIAAQRAFMAPETPGSISGRVTNAEGKLLEGIDVTLFMITNDEFPPSPLRTTKTTANGYKIGILPAGAYILRFDDPENLYAFQFYTQANRWNEAQKIMIAGNQVTGIDVSLAAGGRITGTITDKHHITHTVGLYHRLSGEWRPVEFYKYDSSLTQTDTIEYRFDGLPEDTYLICAWAWLAWNIECYDNVEWDERENASGITLTVGSQISNVNITLAEHPGYALMSGRVTSHEGIPLSGIQVYVDGEGDAGPVTEPTTPDSMTDIDGNYLFKSRGGKFIVRFVDPKGNYVSKYYKDADNGADATSIELQSEQKLDGIDAMLALAARITGTVRLRGETGVYLEGSISAYRRNETKPWESTSASYRTSVSATNGTYNLGGLPPGTYRLHAMIRIAPYEYTFLYLHEFYRDSRTITEATDITIASSQTLAHIDFNLGENEYNSTISGVVTAGGQLLSNVVVELSDFGYNTSLIYIQTDSSGAYHFDGLLSGSYMLRAYDPTNTFAPRYYENHIALRNAERVTVSENTTITNANFILIRAGGLRGNIRQMDGSPAPGLIVQVLIEDEQGLATAAETTTNAQGDYHFLALNPADYLVFVLDKGTHGAVGEYYRCDRSPCQAGKVPVQSGVTTANIDMTFGREPRLYLPLLFR